MCVELNVLSIRRYKFKNLNFVLAVKWHRYSRVEIQVIHRKISTGKIQTQLNQTNNIDINAIVKGQNKKFKWWPVWSEKCTVPNLKRKKLEKITINERKRYIKVHQNLRQSIF